MEPNTLISLALITLLLPLAGFVVLLFTGNRLPRKGDWLGSGMISLAFVLSFIIMITKLTVFPDQPLTGVFKWVEFGVADIIGPVTIEFGIMIDNLAAIMLVVVTLVSMLVHYFSFGYMKGDIRYSRYYAYLGLFSFSMLGIVLTHNILMMYMFWELVGISSYLLIGHWYEKKSASNAATKAFIVNRVGDAGMFIGLMILFISFSSFTFDNIFGAISDGQLPFGSEGWLTAAGILIFLGAVGKSAQFPLHVWLPDAMEGPTPVSALIHAATMVAAGVYLIARVFPILTADALIVIAYIGAITAIIAATIALTQFDIKKVLAYSTISQLGYMTMALGVGAYTAGFMHLVTHAAFKAGLFLGAACVIHAMHEALHKKHDHDTDAQDIRNMGGLKSRLPITYWTFVIFTLAISGIPLTSGFLSKDEILAGTMAFSSMDGHYLLPILGFVVAGLTAFYMFRLLILTFHGNHADSSRLKDIHESPYVMTIPLIVLAILSVFVFYSFNPFGASSGWFYAVMERPASLVPEVLQPATVAQFNEAVSAVHTPAMILSIIIAVLGLVAAFAVYEWKKVSADRIANSMGFLYKGAYNKWYFDDIYSSAFVNGTLSLTQAMRWFDDNVIDAIVNGSATTTNVVSKVSGWVDDNIVDGLVNLTARVTGYIGKGIKPVQTGRVQTYIVYVVFSFIIFFFLFY